MNSPAPTHRQLALAKVSATVAGRSRAAAAIRREEAAAAGDRFVLGATADLPIEWILLEKHPERPAFLAVPADTHPLVASADVETPPGSDAGVLRLRCRFSTWLDAGQLTIRTGTVDGVTLEKAREQVRAARSERGLQASSAGEESPEYRGWIREAIAPALAAVRAAAPVPSPRRERQAPRLRRSRPLALIAAAISLLLAGGLTGWMIRQGEGPGPIGERRSAMTAVAREQAGKALALAGKAAADSRRLVRQLEEQEKQTAALRARIAELETGARTQGARINLPVAILNASDPLRAAPNPFRIPAQASHLVAVLVFPVPAVEYTSYRVVLTRQGSMVRLWQSDRLERLERGINLELPRNLLPPGVYRFQLLGLRGSRAESLGDYELAIAR